MATPPPCSRAIRGSVSRGRDGSRECAAQPWSHAFKHAIRAHQGGKQSCAKMGDERGKQQESKNSVELAQRRVQREVVRQYRWQLQGAKYDDWVASRREHPPTNHGNKTHKY